MLCASVRIQRTADGAVASFSRSGVWSARSGAGHVWSLARCWTERLSARRRSANKSPGDSLRGVGVRRNTLHRKDLTTAPWRGSWGRPKRHVQQVFPLRPKSLAGQPVSKMVAIEFWGVSHAPEAPDFVQEPLNKSRFSPFSGVRGVNSGPYSEGWPVQQHPSLYDPACHHFGLRLGSQNGTARCNYQHTPSFRSPSFGTALLEASLRQAQAASESRSLGTRDAKPEEAQFSGGKGLTRPDSGRKKTFARATPERFSRPKQGQTPRWLLPPILETEKKDKGESDKRTSLILAREISDVPFSVLEDLEA